MRRHLSNEKWFFILIVPAIASLTLFASLTSEIHRHQLWLCVEYLILCDWNIWEQSFFCGRPQERKKALVKNNSHKISFILPGTEYDFIITIIYIRHGEKMFLASCVEFPSVCLNLCYMCINLPLIPGDWHSCEWLDMGLIFCLIGIPNPRARVRWVSCMLNFVYHANWLIRAQAYSSSLALSL